MDSSPGGYSVSMTMPVFKFHIENTQELKEDFEQPPSQKSVQQFIQKIFHKMKLSNEVCLLSFIFIERLIVSNIPFDSFVEERRCLAFIL
jgi:hypothetical protein